MYSQQNQPPYPNQMPPQQQMPQQASAQQAPVQEGKPARRKGFALKGLFTPPPGGHESPSERAERVRKLGNLAAILAVIAVISLILCIYTAVSSSAKSAELDSGAVAVAVAREDIAKGQVVDSSLVEYVSVPSAYRSEGAVAEEDASCVIGHAATCDISKGSQICASNVTGSESPISLSSAIGSDRVAISIAVDARTGVSNLVGVGDEVYVFAAVDGQDQAQLLIDAPVPVLALDESLSTSEGEYETVTLEVTLAQSQRIAAADSSKIYLALGPQA